MTGSPAEARGVTLAISGPRQEAMAIASSERRVTGGILFLLAGLASLAVVLTTGSALALLVFFPVALRQPQAVLVNSAGVPESTGG